VGDAPPSNFDEHIGTEWLELEADEARGRIEVADHHKQPLGVVHGGVMATLAESLSSAATYKAVAPEGKVAMGQSNSVTLMRPVSEGHVNAIARSRHRGRSTWVWDTELSDDQGRVCALVRTVIAVRPAPER
jgi:1,4-dihydroxy-2-naphthoyl-CoA hydrolase